MLRNILWIIGGTIMVMVIAGYFGVGRLAGPTVAPRPQEARPAEPTSPVESTSGGALSVPAQPNATGGVVNIPSTGWGRNPFAWINELVQPAAPEQLIVQTPVRPAVPQGLPTYQVTAILSGAQGNWAVIDKRVFQAGDRLGNEIVKEIKPDAVVLEFQGRTRELPLNKPGSGTIVITPRGGAE